MTKMERKYYLMALLLSGTILAAASQQALAQRQTQPPQQDVRGLQDHPALPRYADAVLIETTAFAYDEFSLPRAVLRPTGKEDSSNNRVFADPEPLRVEGRRTRLVYLLPPERTPLEAVRGYQQAVREAGGEVLYECREEECGGNPQETITTGGNSTGLLKALYPKTEARFAMGVSGAVECSLDIGRRLQRYTLMRVRDGAHAAVLAFAVQPLPGNYCQAYTGRTAVVVVVAEPKAREQRMAVVAAPAMAQGIAREGRIALYAVFFDFDRAELKPESGPQLAEVARYLRTEPQVSVVVAGHTDSRGGIDYNLDLSRRRAQAVVASLAREHGITAARLAAQGVGMASPVTTNETDEGRARNRRVEVVRQ